MLHGFVERIQVIRIGVCLFWTFWRELRLKRRRSAHRSRWSNCARMELVVTLDGTNRAKPARSTPKSIPWNKCDCDPSIWIHSYESETKKKGEIEKEDLAYRYPADDLRRDGLPNKNLLKIIFLHSHFRAPISSWSTCTLLPNDVPTKGAQEKKHHVLRLSNSIRILFNHFLYSYFEFDF